MVQLGPRAPTIIGIMWLEFLLATIFVGLRIYTRTRIIRKMGWEDHLALASIVLFLGYAICCTLAAIHGLGSHYADLQLEQFVRSNKFELMGQTFNIIAIATSKSSVAAFLLRLVTSRVHKIFLWFCLISTCIVCVSCAIFLWVACTPIESVWNPTIEHKCSINYADNAIFSGSYTAAMDFVLAVFPWYFLMNVQMKSKERMTISVGLSAGVLAGICGIIRAIELSALNAKSDYSYQTVPLILWGSTELLISIVCACIPVLRPLYKKIRGRQPSNSYTYPPHSGSVKMHLRPTSRFTLSSMPDDDTSPPPRSTQQHGDPTSTHGEEAKVSYYHQSPDLESNLNDKSLVAAHGNNVDDGKNIKKVTTIQVSSQSSSKFSSSQASS